MLGVMHTDGQSWYTKCRRNNFAGELKLALLSFCRLAQSIWVSSQLYYGKEGENESCRAIQIMSDKFDVAYLGGRGLFILWSIMQGGGEGWGMIVLSKFFLIFISKSYLEILIGFVTYKHRNMDRCFCFFFY